MITRREFLRAERLRRRRLNRWPLSKKLKALVLILIALFFAYGLALKVLGLG